MKTIIYAGGELVTGDDIAAALLRYGEALAESSAAETVEIPVLEADGSRTIATVLIGPASQIMMVEAHTDFEELVDPDSVRRLDEGARSVRPEAVAEHERPDASWSEEY